MSTVADFIKLSSFVLIGFCSPGYLYGQMVEMASADLVRASSAATSSYLYFAPAEVDERNRDALNKVISVNLNSVSMEDALQLIADRADLRLSYSIDVALEDWHEAVSVNLEEATILGALYAVLGPTDLRLKITPKGLVIVHKDEKNENLITDLHDGRFELIQETISGRVIDAGTGEPLPGVNIVAEGTMTGTTTDVNGEFSLVIPVGSEALLFSYIGYETQRVERGTNSVFNIRLQPTAISLGEAVVTALGLERDRSTLGYSVSQIEATDIVAGTEYSVANLLQGQAAGVQVTSVGGVGSSTRVVIRGVSSLTGDNQPLYVVDGVPIRNTTRSQVGMYGGTDGGDGIQNLNPADIESMTVLKGASAAALYGEEARDGVILITTKKGSEGQLSVSFTNSTTFDFLMDMQKDIQREYGQGFGGKKPATQTEAHASMHRSWGGRFDGQPTVQFDGVMRPYENVYGNKNPQSDFYETAISTDNTLSVNGGSSNATYYLSASNLNSNDIIPNFKLNRTSLTARTNVSVGRLNADVKVNYVDQGVNNRSGQGDHPGNANFSVLQIPRNVPMSAVKNYVYNDDGSAILLIHDRIWSQNPYWLINERVQRDRRRRVIGHVNLSYSLTDWLSLSSQTGMDYYVDHRKNWTSWGDAQTYPGNLSENDQHSQIRNTEIMLTGSRDLTSFLHVDAMVGGAIRHQYTETFILTGSDYIFPGRNVISNMLNTDVGYGFSESETRSIFGSASFGYNEYLFLNLTGRNDWSSTLPINNNSFFYPSVGVSFLFSEAFASKMPKWVSLGQLRATWGQVGSATSPYQLTLNYSTASQPFGNIPFGSISGSTVPQVDLKPTLTNEIELGADIRFLDDRVGIDISWYDRQTTNQIINATVSGTSGWSSRRINAGQIDNSGWDLQLSGVPVAKADLFWRSTLNYSRNKSYVRELIEEAPSTNLAQSRTQTAFIVAEAGQEFGMIRGTTYVRDAEGNIVHENGLPITGPYEFLGRGTPTWTGSWLNTISWKNFSFNALLDVQWGGQIFSATNAYLHRKGLHINTLRGRAECDAAGWTPTGCYVYEGVDVNGGPNTTPVLPEQYFTRIGNVVEGIAEENVYDNNTIYMRQIGIGYSLPADLISRFGAQSVTVSVIGRNLFMIYNSVPNVDPTLTLNRGNAQGLELAGVPGTRSLGFNVNVQF